MIDPDIENHDRKKPRISGEASFFSLLLSPGYWPVALFEVAVGWFFTRSWLRLFLVFPLAAGIVLILITSNIGSRLSATNVAGRYLELAEKAEGRSDHQNLDLYYRRLLNTPLQDATRFKMAAFLASHGKLEQARSQMQLLAPEDKAGYGQAHLWVVQDILASKDVSLRTSKLFEHHVEKALEMMPDDPVALWIGSQVRFRNGRNEEGLSLLEKAALKQGEFNLSVAELHKRMGNEASYRIYLDRATSFYKDRFAKDPKNIQFRVGYIQCLILTNSTDEVIQIAEDGLRVQPTDAMRQWVVQSYLQVFDRLSLNEKSGDRGIRYLERALELEPQNPGALERIAGLVAMRPEVDWKQLKQKLEETLVAGNAPATVHVLLADGLLQRGEMESAKVHLEQAMAQRPDMLAVLNNLAWIAAFKEPLDLERAEQLIEQAMEIAPGHAEVRETRGAIFLKQKKYTQAIAMLEPLLQVFPKRKELRLWIAEAYTEVGDASMAQRYRDQANQLLPDSK